MLDVDFPYFDFVHTVLPTRLTLKEYYRQLYWLYRRSIPATRYIAYLRQYPVSQMIAVFWTNYRLLSRLKNAYKDYQ